VPSGLGALILFKRNMETGVKYPLVMELRNFLDKADAPVLIDREGGRVVQLTPPLWPCRSAPAQLVTAQIARRTGYDYLERSTGEGVAQ
jgi:beta-N-acetylhexosaminidase